MAAIPLKDMAKAIVKRNPNGGVYIARPSYAKGVTPAHLAGYTERFTAAARECASATKGMNADMEHPRAIRACIKGKLGR